VGIRADDWLSGVFGYPVFAVDAAAAPDVAQHARAHDRAFYFAKVTVDRTPDLTVLTDAGFAVVDVNVTLTHDGSRVDAAASHNVSAFRPGEAERVLDIAGSCFRYSRFHLDPRVARATADAVKREWIANYVGGRRGLELLVARDGEEPVGFLAVLEDGPARVIDLVGVAPERQSEGIGSALVTAFVQQHAPHASELRVGTQIANAPSLRLYTRSGFRIERSAYVLHHHVGAGA
jgi:dTDP-4-amino-4,6-dideoxy-D-galactose acyltransferase